jgi:uncharacterized protein GlcG (DUF336 family)
MSLTLIQANAIVAAALAHGASLNASPISVAVLDAGGHLLAFQRQDGSSNLRPQIAIAKAAGTLALGLPSRKIAEIAQAAPATIASLATLSAGGLVPSPGGVIVIDGKGMTVGAVGVTGDTPDNDELCAIAGVTGAGLAVRS